LVAVIGPSGWRPEPSQNLTFWSVPQPEDGFMETGDVVRNVRQPFLGQAVTRLKWNGVRSECWDGRYGDPTSGRRMCRSGILEPRT
jgi:hypothetical protein